MILFIKKAYWLIRSKYYYYRQKFFYPIIERIQNRKLEVSIADLLLQRDEISQIQFLVASRLLDIEEYNSKNSVENFRCQRAISIHDSGLKYMSDDTYNNKFESLIASYSNKGYDKQSLLYVDNRFTLENGTHRIAMHIHHNIPFVNVEYHYHSCSHQDGLFPYYQNKYNSLSTTFINEVIEKYKQIQQWLVDEGMTFSCLVYYNIGSEIDVFIKDLSALTIVLKVSRIPVDSYYFKNQDSSSISELAVGRDGAYYIQFRLANPQYKVTKDGYYSQTVKKIASVLSERYSDRKSLNFVFAFNCGEGYKLYKSLL